MQDRDSKIIGELENLSMFSDNSFDGAVSFSTLRYVTNVEKCLYEIYRVLKPGAALVADFPNKWCPWFKIIKPFILRKRHINDHAYSAKEVINFFTRAGFKHIDVRMILSSAPYISLCTLPYEKFMESFSNRAGFLRKFAGIIMCKGIK